MTSGLYAITMWITAIVCLFVCVRLCYCSLYVTTVSKSRKKCTKHFAGCDLTQTAWLLKTVAIELKVTAAHQQMSQLSSIINALVIDKSLRPERHCGSSATGVQLAHSFKNDLG